MRMFAAEALGVWGSDQHAAALTGALDDTGEEGKVAGAARRALEAIRQREHNEPKGTSGN